ncbi:MAG: response regulator, partial [Magnetococcales bacterium]|nr:response regulator [Magnetococcales bacterium]
VRIYGYASAHELQGQPMEILNSGHSPAPLSRTIRDNVRTGRKWTGEMLNQCKDGSQVWVRQHFAPIQQEDGAIHHYLVILEDVTELRLHRENLEQTVLERTAELEKSRDAAEAGARAKATFLVNMSHEIRTPMNGVLGMADLIMQTSLTRQQRHYVETIHRSGHMLLRIINDILDLSKIQAGQLTMEMLRFDLNQVLGDICAIFSTQAKRNGLDFVCKLAETVPLHLLGDPYRLNQVLFNLIGNAIKFTERGSVVLSMEIVQLRKVDVVLRFQVQDTGIGISPDYQPRIFETFSQEDPSVSRKFGGTGLGLAISRELVLRMGGDLWMESVPGQGSTFRFTVRFGRQQRGDRREICAWQGQQRLATPDNLTFSGRILLVEDNPVNQEVAVATLERFGCQVTVAGNGQQALSLFRAAVPGFDAIFMDCEMPVMDGFETTRQLRLMEQQAGVAPTPIIALTAHVLQESRDRCNGVGMDDYLQKPFSQSEMGVILNRWLVHAHPDTREETPAGAPEDAHADGESAPVAPVLDQVVVERILELARKGGGDLLDRMLDHYLTRTPELLAELQLALRQNDSEGVRVAAHTLKSSSLTMGVARLAELGRTMERACTDLPLAAQHFLLSGPVFAEAVTALEALRRSQQTRRDA